MKILVLSENDAFCGPMAAAFLRDYSPSFEVVSAGYNPSETLDPMTVTVMKECLSDLSGYVPRDVKAIDISDFDKVYECPDLPAPKTVDGFRRLRDFIKNDTYLFFKKLHPQTLNNSKLSTLNSQLFVNFRFVNQIIK